jgi:hypothetical protein
VTSTLPILQNNRREFPAVLDSTMLHSFRACPQQFWLSYIRRVTTAGRNPHFNAGGAFAKGLETARRVFCKLRGEGVTRAYCEGEATRAGLVALWKSYGNHEVGERFRHKAWDRTSAALVSYLDRWPLWSDHVQVAEWQGKHLVEFSFAIDLPFRHPVSGDPILYCGRLDWVGKYNETYFAVDEKTTKYFQETWASKWSLRAQLTGYAWACRQYGIPVAGTIVRGTAMKLTEIEHAEAVMSIPQWRIDRWYEQTLRNVQQMLNAWESGIWDYDLGDSCVAYNGCQFTELCKVQNYEPWLTPEAGMFVPNTWNPLDKDDE